MPNGVPRAQTFSNIFAIDWMNTDIRGKWRNLRRPMLDIKYRNSLLSLA